MAVISALSFTHAEAQSPAASWPTVGSQTKAGSRWWWLGSAVDEDNLVWNIDQLSAAGIGTLEITPIYGVKGNAANNIAFLSNDWLDKLHFTIDKCHSSGVNIDMTTGTGWPFGGPMLKMEETASKLVTETTDIDGDGVTVKTIATTGTSAKMLQRVLAYPQGTNTGSPTDITSLLDGKTVRWTAPEGKWRVIAVYCQFQVMTVKRAAPGSEGYVLDHFDADAVKTYLDYFDKRFAAGGNPWPSTFFNDSYEINAADWTRDMFAQFQKYRGYKLEDCMDKLLARDPQVLADYRQTLSDMLLHNFTEQWTEWAHSHGAQTRNQAHGSPGNLIDLYAAADIPETETFYISDFGIKGLRSDPGFTMKALSTRATLKYASSAAHITGKPLTSSESMTWLTEHFRSSLSQMKPELDLLFTSGVNRVMFHGTTYSPREAAWPGWKFYAAVDMSPTNSIWRDAPQMLGYIERVQSFMQMGQPDNDVLVYAPFVSAMHKTTGDFQSQMLLFDINKMTTKMPEMETCVNELEAAGFDCDYISDRYLMQTTFADGKLLTPGGVYRALVVPVSDYMPDSVSQHIDELKAQGAIIYNKVSETVAAGSALAGSAEELRSVLGLSVVRRKSDTGHHYFIANLTGNDVNGSVSLAVSHSDALWFNPMTGDTPRHAAFDADGKLMVSLKSGESAILQTFDGPVTAGEARNVAEIAGVEIGGPWTLRFADNCEPQMGDTEYQLPRLQTWETLDERTARLMGTGIYETTFTVSPLLMKMGAAGFRLSLGDVRESARVWLNDRYLGCAWAVPFELDCLDAVREGENTLKIEVTNLPANRISQMDRDGVVWRIFEDINMSNISTDSYAKWSPVPSGLNTKVKLVPLTDGSGRMQCTLKGMMESDDHNYYPYYEVTMGDGNSIDNVAATDKDGNPFDGIEVLMENSRMVKPVNNTCTLVVKGLGKDCRMAVDVTDGSGRHHFAYLPAYGPYSCVVSADLTGDEAPGGGWMKLQSQSDVKGFDTGKIDWYRATLNGKEVKGLYEGLTFSSDRSAYYFYFPGYGMNANSDFRLSVDDAVQGDLLRLDYAVGTGSTKYSEDVFHTSFTLCEEPASGIVLDMPGNASYYVYRGLQLYRPLTPLAGVESIAADRGDAPVCYYTLQGTRVSRPAKGLYIRDGRKVIIK